MSLLPRSLLLASATQPFLKSKDPLGLSTLASTQTKGTEETNRAAKQLLDYCDTHPEAIIRFRASPMMLKMHSDASYLTEPEARSRASGWFFLGGNKQTGNELMYNGPILVLANIIRNVMSSAAEAEVGAIFDNAKAALPLRATLQEMGHPQPTAEILTDNTTAEKIANDTCKQKQSKATDMRFCWIRDRIKQKQFQVKWGPADINLADYHSKHHPATHHQRVRHWYLHAKNSPTILPTTHARSHPARVC